MLLVYVFNVAFCVAGMALWFPSNIYFLKEIPLSSEKNMEIITSAQYSVHCTMCGAVEHPSCCNPESN